MDEILTIFIRHCFARNCRPTVAGLYKFIADSPSKNYRFMCDVSFNIVLPLFMFRCGVRRNNHSFIHAGKCKFMKLFYGLHMTFYQELMYQDLKTLVLAPQEVKSFLAQTASFSCSGHPSKGEGGDFVLEAINGKIKKWLPQGIPTDQHWLQVCRNLDRLHEIRQVICKELDLKSDEAKVYTRDISTEITQWRAKLRSNGYLCNDNNSHTSVDGEELDRALISFETHCRQNMEKYIKTIVNADHQPGKAIPLVPIFTTTAARSKFHALENKTKAQLVQLITEGISTVRTNGDVEESLVLQSQWQTIKVKTKNDMLRFYKEVVAAVENSTVTQNEDDNDSGVQNPHEPDENGHPDDTSDADDDDEVLGHK